MAKKKDDINIRSEEMVAFMTRIPSVLSRYGLFAMFILVFFVLGMSWFIKYPELIVGKITLTTSEEPIKMVTQTSGILKRLQVEDGQLIEPGTILAEIENPFSAGTAEYLKVYLFQLDKALLNNLGELPLPDTSTEATGDLQSEINELVMKLNAFNSASRFKMDDIEIKSLNEKISNQKELIRVNERIVSLGEKELEEGLEKLAAEEQLFKEGFTARMDFLRLKSAFREKELKLEQIKQSVIEQKNQLNSYELQFNQAGFNKYSRNKILIDGIQGNMQSIRSFVFGWRQKYNLVAMKGGKVVFLKRLQPGIFLKGGEELFAILPPDGNYLGIAFVPTTGYGRIREGQDVNILLDNYPFFEFGMLKGKVKSFSLFSNTNEYRVEISLPEGMVSTQKENLEFIPEMSGEVEIVTADKRLIERLLDSVTRAFKRKRKT